VLLSNRGRDPLGARAVACEIKLERFGFVIPAAGRSGDEGIGGSAIVPSEMDWHSTVNLDWARAGVQDEFIA
jgi:hypothetical protein